jgi:hypothetical protein
MFGFLKKKDETASTSAVSTSSDELSPVESVATPESVSSSEVGKSSWRDRLKAGLAKTRTTLNTPVS